MVESSTFISLGNWKKSCWISQPSENLPIILDFAWKKRVKIVTKLEFESENSFED
jgi:hypothetical protein